uniref:Uncharacterized protein n=1 Tax=Sphaerodactylus townsendi TaxID=933632 RepID=A0ACB8F149_9SAUR
MAVGPTTKGMPICWGFCWEAVLERQQCTCSTEEIFSELTSSKLQVPSLGGDFFHLQPESCLEEEGKPRDVQTQDEIAQNYWVGRGLLEMGVTIMACSLCSIPLPPFLFLTFFFEIHRLMYLYSSVWLGNNAVFMECQQSTFGDVCMQKILLFSAIKDISKTCRE